MSIVQLSQNQDQRNPIHLEFESGTMSKAKGLDRALLHGLHLRLASNPELISPAALRAVMRVAEAYTQGIRDKRNSGSENEELYEDGLALLEILTLALRQSEALNKALQAKAEDDGQ